jgi:hypothetical protein
VFLCGGRRWIVRYLDHFVPTTTGWPSRETPSDEPMNRASDWETPARTQPATAQRGELDEESETQTSRAPLSRGPTPASLGEMELSRKHPEFVAPDRLRSTGPLAVMTTRKLLYPTVGRLGLRPSLPDLHASTKCDSVHHHANYPGAELVCTRQVISFPLDRYFWLGAFRPALDLEQSIIPRNYKLKTSKTSIFVSFSCLSSRP